MSVVRSSGPERWYELTGTRRNLEAKMSAFSISIVPTGASEDTVMTNFGFRTEPDPEGPSQKTSWVFVYLIGILDSVC